MMFPREYVYIYSLQESILVWRLFTPFIALWPVRYHWWRDEASAPSWSLSPSPREPVQDVGMRSIHECLFPRSMEISEDQASFGTLGGGRCTVDLQQCQHPRMKKPYVS